MMAERGRPATEVSGREGMKPFLIGSGMVPTSSDGGRRNRRGQGVSRSVVLPVYEYPLVSRKTVGVSTSMKRLSVRLSPLVLAARTPTFASPKRFPSIL